MKEVLCLHISPLFGDNAKRFEEMMYEWVQSVSRLHYKAVKIFDGNQLLVGKPVKVDEEKNIYRVTLKRLTIEYMCLSGDMCMFTKVSEVKGEVTNVIYTVPESWDGVHLWHAC